MRFNLVVNNSTLVVHVRDPHLTGLTKCSLNWQRFSGITTFEATEDRVTCKVCRQRIGADRPPEKKKPKWKTNIYINDPRNGGVMDEDWAFEDFEYEVSIIRQNYKLGKESLGWSGNKKLVLFDSDHCEGQSFSNEDQARNYIENQIAWMKKVAEITAKALNREGL